MKFTSKVFIDKGWSDDRKYCVTDADGAKYLLRVSPVEKQARRAEVFRRMQKAAALGIPMNAPLDFGLCEEGVYTLLSWIDGEDAETAIPRLPEAEQYALGLEAGRMLRKLHSIPAPAGLPDWETGCGAKIEKRNKNYRDCPYKISGEEHILAYIEENRHLLRGRPQCFLHGDYHIGNMMLEKGKLVLIDFDRCGFGDPWQEFNRLVWCAKAAPAFARGRVDGYFDGEVPADFWRLLALYIAGNALGAVPWAIPFGPGEIHTMLNQAQDVLRWYDNMRNPVPTWYQGA